MFPRGPKFGRIIYLILSYLIYLICLSEKVDEIGAEIEEIFAEGPKEVYF
jgi:hypothetical protein